MPAHLVHILEDHSSRVLRAAWNVPLSKSQEYEAALRAYLVAEHYRAQHYEGGR